MGNSRDAKIQHSLPADGIEREGGKHWHFSSMEDVPFQKIEKLRRGGFGHMLRKNASD
jgi:hypothetical protein